MRYFDNITTAEDLKKAYRQYCQSLHPDKGGNVDEFQEMLNQYESFKKNIDAELAAAAERAEAARMREEEAKREEAERVERERQEAEELQKMRPIIAKWSGILHDVPASGQDWRACKKERSAYLAAVKRNIKAIFTYYFPGVKVSVKISNKTWSEYADIEWTDGPTVAEVEAVKEWAYFPEYFHVCSPYEDYGHDETHKNTREWRAKFGQIGAYSFGFSRSFSTYGKSEVLAKIYEILPQFAGMDLEHKSNAFVECSDTHRINKLFGFCFECDKSFAEMTDEERRVQNDYELAHYDERQEVEHLDSGHFYNNITPLSSVYKVFTKYYKVSAEATAEANKETEAPKFTPVYGPMYKAIKKALGVNVLARQYGSWDKRDALDIFEAAELLAAGEALDLCKFWFSSCDDTRNCSGVAGGGLKTQEKRAAKFATVGLTVGMVGQYATVQIKAISSNVLEALRAERAEVEAQRKAWEESQSEPKAEKNDKKATQSAQAEKVGEVIAEADGVQLVATENGAAFTGNTYAHKEEIKAIGARWYRLGGCWTINADKVDEAYELVNSWVEVETVAEPEQVTEEATEPKSESENIAGRVYVVTLKADESGNISQSVGGYCNSIEEAQKYLQNLKLSSVIPGYRKVFAEYNDGYGLPCSFSMVEEPGALPSDDARVWIKFVLWEDSEGVGPDGVPFMGFLRNEFIEDIIQDRTKEKLSSVSTMDAATCEAFAAVLASVADIVSAIKEYNEQTAGVRPDIANVLLSVMDKMSDKAQTLATVCAVLAGFYPESRDAFDALGLRAWSSGADELPAIWSDLIDTARGIEEPLADWLGVHGVAA